MKVIVNSPTIIGGLTLEPSHLPQVVPADVGKHLMEIGNAVEYVEKVVEVKKKVESLLVSQPAPASRRRTAKRSRKPE